MKGQTRIKVAEVAELSRAEKHVALVEILSGNPSVNMRLSIPGKPGIWCVVGFGTMPASFQMSHVNFVNLLLVCLAKGSELQAGVELAESD